MSKVGIFQSISHGKFGSLSPIKASSDKVGRSSLINFLTLAEFLQEFCQGNALSLPWVLGRAQACSTQETVQGHVLTTVTPPLLSSHWWTASSRFDERGQQGDKDSRSLSSPAELAISQVWHWQGDSTPMSSRQLSPPARD